MKINEGEPITDHWKKKASTEIVLLIVTGHIFVGWLILRVLASLQARAI